VSCRHCWEDDETGIHIICNFGVVRLPLLAVHKAAGEVTFASHQRPFLDLARCLKKKFAQLLELRETPAVRPVFVH
jgi:hypothetical protein